MIAVVVRVEEVASEQAWAARCSKRMRSILRLARSFLFRPAERHKGRTITAPEPFAERLEVALVHPVAETDEASVGDCTHAGERLVRVDGQIVEGPDVIAVIVREEHPLDLESAPCLEAALRRQTLLVDESDHVAELVVVVRIDDVEESDRAVRADDERGLAMPTRDAHREIEECDRHLSGNGFGGAAGLRIVAGRSEQIGGEDDGDGEGAVHGP